MAKGDKTKELWKDPTYRKHMSDAHKGKRHEASIRAIVEAAQSAEGRRRMSVIGKRFGGWNKGKKMESISGKNHYKWIKDRSQLAKTQERNDSSYREWRKSVRDRDGWKCKMANHDCNGKVVAHHILPWASFPELRYETNNGITLCNFHHPRKRSEEMRLSPYFQSLLVNET